MEPLQGSFGPASFGVVAADGDDDIIGEPMIVHCLVRSLCRLAANCVKSSGIVSLMENLSHVYNVPETRGFWKKRLIAIGVLIVTSAFFFASFGLLALGHRTGIFVAAQLHLGPGFRIVWEIFRWCFLVALLQTAVAIIDNVLPNTKRPWRWIAPGTLFDTVMLVLGTSAVNFYVRHVGHYYESYGAIGAFFVLMVCGSLSPASLCW